MVSAIGPGDFVVCVDAQKRSASHSSPGERGVLCDGRVYLVTKVGAAKRFGPLLWLSGVPNSTHGGYCLWRFAPFQGPEQAKRVVSEPVDGRVPA